MRFIIFLCSIISFCEFATASQASQAKSLSHIYVYVMNYDLNRSVSIKIWNENSLYKISESYTVPKSTLCSIPVSKNLENLKISFTSDDRVLEDTIDSTQDQAFVLNP